MDKIIGIELDKFGFSIDSEWVYLSLSWQFITLALLSGVAYKIYKRKKG